MRKTIVESTAECDRRLKKDMRKGLFSRGDLEVIRTWYEDMTRKGSTFIKKSPEWGDHPLYREWNGHRSSNFSKEGRIIYRITGDNNIEVVSVERITPDHNYKK